MKHCGTEVGRKAPKSPGHAPAEPDPHGTRYQCERSALALGHLDDDELANGAFMNYDAKLDIARVLANEPEYHPPIVWMTAVKDRIRWLSRQLAAPTAPQAAPATFQARVQPWMLACFGAETAADKQERNHRFLEEALELVQSCDCTASEAHQLVNYVFGRPVGERAQEVGGVMVTLAALCLAQGLDMHEAGETELARIWTKVDQIRAKQAAKPKNSPLPQASPAGVVPLTEAQLIEGCVVGSPTAPEAVVMPPFSPEQRAAACVAACEGLPDHALFGGWTAAGLSRHANALEVELAALKASLPATGAKDLQVAAELWLLTRAKDAPNPDQWTALDVTAAYVAGAMAERQRREGQA